MQKTAVITRVFFDQEIIGARRLDTHEDFDQLVARINRDTRKPFVKLTDTENNIYAVDRRRIVMIVPLKGDYSSVVAGRDNGDLRGKTPTPSFATPFPQSPLKMPLDKP